MVFLTGSQFETEDIGRRVGQLTGTGAFVALYGDLGGGKTCFVRGFMQGLSPENVTAVASPTYAIMNEYPGTPAVYHFDLYRISGASEMIELGLDEYFSRDGICIIEWAERLGELLPENRIDIVFEHAGDDRRRLTLKAVGPDAANILSGLEKLQ